jgi:ketosteroid isomerase-like protein
MEATAAVDRFNDCINRRDLDGLVALMTPDHTFIDSAGGAIAGRDACRDAWTGFFAAFPDYRNVFESYDVRGDVVTVRGRSECSEPALRGPARWTVVVRGDAIARWEVADDPQPIRT